MSDNLIDGFDTPSMKTDDDLRSMAFNLSSLESAYNEQNDFKPGQFYSFVYDYLDSPSFHKQSPAEQRFYDRQPLVYFYGYQKDPRYIECLNFHFMPVESRHRWLDTVERMTAAISKNERINLPPDILKKINLKNDAAVRIYKLERMSQVHRLDSSKLGAVMDSQARTFEGAGYGTVALRYRTWHPKEK